MKGPSLIILFLALMVLFFAYGHLDFTIHFYLTCALLVISTGCNIFFVLDGPNPKRLKTPLLLIVFIVFGLLFGFLSCWIVGSQTHDQYEGGLSLGMDHWPVLLGVVYPVCFFLFVLSLRFVSRVIQILMLFTWAVATCVIGYFSTDNESFYKDIQSSGKYYDSTYFPSETKTATPIIVSTVLLCTVWLFLRKWKRGIGDNTIHNI